MTPYETQPHSPAELNEQKKLPGRRFLPGLLVHTQLQAGVWRCNSCAGQTVGNQLFKPTCTYCEVS